MVDAGAQIARECFAAGVALARARRYAEARAQFASAYAATPHFIALYNMGLLDIQLGQPASAAQLLRRYLAEGGGGIPADQRERVAREITRLDALVTAGLARTENSTSRTEAVSVPAPAFPRPVPPPSDANNRAESVGFHNRVAPSATAQATEKGSLASGYFWVAGGFAAFAGAAAAYIYNHERYLDWKRQHQQLLTLRQAGPLSTEEEAAVRARVYDTNAKLRSVERFDPVPFVIAGLGVLASGFGLWTLAEAEQERHWGFVGGSAELMLEIKSAW